MVDRRPALQAVAGGRDALEEALDRERRQLMRVDEERMDSYMVAATPWADAWLETQRGMAGLPLKKAHDLMVDRATVLLPERTGFSP